MNAKTQTMLTPSLQVAIENLKRAKAAIVEWEAYRLNIEAEIVKDLEKQGVFLPEAGSVEVGPDLMIICQERRDYDQGCLAEFVQKHEYLEGTVFVRELKPAKKELVDSFLASENPAVADLKACFKMATVKPSFRTTK